MKGARLQLVNAAILLAQLLASIACFTMFIASQHEMRTQDGSIWFYWNHTYSTLISGEGNVNYGDSESPAGNGRGKCQAGGIVAMLLNVIALPILAVNLLFGIVRLMSLPQAFLSKFLNPDRWRWVGREWGRCGCALALQGLALIVFGSTCTSASVQALPQGNLVLTGLLFELLAWFLLLGATLSYKVVWDAIPQAYGEQAQDDALELDDAESGVRHRDDNARVDGLTGVGIDRDDGSKFHHPDSAQPSSPPGANTAAAASNGNPASSPTLAQRKLITTEEALRLQAAKDAQGKLNLDHVLKDDPAAAAGVASNATSSRKSSQEHDEAANIAGMREINLLSPAAQGLNARPASAGLSPRPNSPQRKSSGLAIDIGRV